MSIVDNRKVPPYHACMLQGLRKRLIALLAVLISTATLQAWLVSSAVAMNQDCASGLHCYAVRFGSPTAATGVFVNQHSNTMTQGGVASSSFQSFITSEMWLQDPSAAHYWVEEGLVNGWDDMRGQVVYAVFTFTRDVNGNDSGWSYLNLTVPDGTTHYHQISRGTSTGLWNVYLDGTLKFVSFPLGFWTGRPVVGGECYCNASNEHADTFNLNTTAEDAVGNISTYSASGYNVHAGENGVDHGSYWSWNAP